MVKDNCVMFRRFLTCMPGPDANVSDCIRMDSVAGMIPIYIYKEEERNSNTLFSEI